jgi:hypothetical protein
MKTTLISSAILGLGVSLFAAPAAHADPYSRDRDHERVYREDYRHEGYRSERFNESVDWRDLPGRVRDRADDYRHGRSIESIRYIREDGEPFYRFRIDDRRHGDFYIDIAPNGHLLGRLDR